MVGSGNELAMGNRSQRWIKTGIVGATEIPVEIEEHDSLVVPVQVVNFFPQ